MRIIPNTIKKMAMTMDESEAPSSEMKKKEIPTAMYSSPSSILNHMTYLLSLAPSIVRIFSMLKSKHI